MHPRITDTAKRLWLLYFGLTLVEAILLKLAGMGYFDAINHAFATMATGGFSTYNTSVANFDSEFIDYLLVVFMILEGTNFTLLYWVGRGQPRRLWEDTELRTFLTLIFLATLLILISGAAHGDFAIVGVLTANLAVGVVKKQFDRRGTHRLAI